MDKEPDLFKKLSRDFTKTVLGNYQPDNNCFTVSFPLSLHLDNNGFNNTMRVGRFYDGSDKDGTPHFWLRLDSDTDNIIDPTAKQFYPDLEEPLLFGPKPKHYHEVDRPFEQWFCTYQGNPGSYISWSKALLKHDQPDPIPSFIPPEELPKQNKQDIKVLLEINLRAAAILYAECKKKKITPSDLHKKYFTCIARVIQKFHDRSELTELSLPDEFDTLLKDTLKK